MNIFCPERTDPGESKDLNFYAILCLQTMTSTTHAAMGAALGTIIGNPVLGFSLGLISHFAVDMIPHGDNELSDRYRVQKKKRLPLAFVTLDSIIAIILTMFFVAYRPDNVEALPFIAAITGSVLPDMLVAVAELAHKKSIFNAYYKFHFFFHDYFSRRYGDIKLRYALLGQFVFVVAVFELILK